MVHYGGRAKWTRTQTVQQPTRTIDQIVNSSQIGYVTEQKSMKDYRTKIYNYMQSLYASIKTMKCLIKKLIIVSARDRVSAI